jgi:chitinase
MFAKAVLKMINEYNLDGVDIEYAPVYSCLNIVLTLCSWEYPNKQGLGCNAISEQDTPNFLAFLQELRSTPGGGDITITAATSIVPFASPDGTPSSNVSAFADVLDYITLMNYDLWGSWSTVVGPNAPLDDSCASLQQGSAVSAVAAWKAAGIPANKLVLATASYGHSYFVTQDDAFAGASADGTQPPGTRPLTAYPPFDRLQQPFGDSWDTIAPAGPDECGAYSPGGPSGIFNFRGLVEQGFLNQNGTAIDGMGFRFDHCSQTVRSSIISEGGILITSTQPYVYDPKSSTMVSYDDAQSFGEFFNSFWSAFTTTYSAKTAAKGRFIQELGLRGFSMWEAAGDYKDILLDAISIAMGITSSSC